MSVETEDSGLKISSVALLELVDWVQEIFGDTSDFPLVAFLEKCGYVYDLHNEVWQIPYGMSLTQEQAMCFQYLMIEYDYGPPVLFTYRAKIPFPKEIDIDLDVGVDCH